MTTFGPLTVDELIEVQAIASGPGGTTFSQSVFISPDCGTGSADCAITSNTNTVTGPAGTAVNLGGSATGAFTYQETVELGSAPWLPKAPITQIEAGYLTRNWRICCVDNPTVCSSPQTVRETFGPGTIYGLINEQGAGNVQGVTVNLWETVNDVPLAVIDTATTTQYGGYTFPSLPDGTYAIEMVAPAGCVWSFNNSTTYLHGEFTISGGSIVPFVNGTLICN